VSEDDKATAVMWPPLPASEGPAIGDACARASWFAGHLFERILVPVAGDPGEVRVPEHTSLAALADLGRVRVCGVPEATQAASSGRCMVLVQRADVSDAAPLKAAKFAGSLEVRGLAPSGPDGARYYFVGSPAHDLQDAYHWVCLSYWMHADRQEADVLAPSRRALAALKAEARRHARVAIFGTGPSLAEALDRDHSGAFNMICNSIVKNRPFCERLRPRVIVAADAHFHFSYHHYSAALLHDLAHQLRTSDAVFFTFDKFAAFLRRRMPSIADKVFGIPAGRKEYGYDFDRDFRVHAGDSVLNMFLLPLASYLGEEIVLNGFTGRAKTDTYFWSHSELNQYGDRMADVRSAHGAFFANRDYGAYSDTVDQEISLRVERARGEGKRVASATRSFYTALAAQDA